MSICYMCTHLTGYVAVVMGDWLMFEGIVACTLVRGGDNIEGYEGSCYFIFKSLVNVDLVVI